MEVRMEEIEGQHAAGFEGSKIGSKLDTIFSLMISCLT